MINKLWFYMIAIAVAFAATGRRLEILTEDGKTKSWAIDFNSDGKVDVLKAAMAEDKAQEPQHAPELSQVTDEAAAGKLLQLSH